MVPGVLAAYPRYQINPFSQEVIWTFSEKGSIEFACNVPGHYQAGMYGEVNFN